MKMINAEIVRRGGKTLSYLLSASFAVVATQVAVADTWVGGTSSGYMTEAANWDSGESPKVYARDLDFTNGVESLTVSTDPEETLWMLNLRFTRGVFNINGNLNLHSPSLCWYDSVAGDSASVTKEGDWYCNYNLFLASEVEDTVAYFTNKTGNLYVNNWSQFAGKNNTRAFFTMLGGTVTFNDGLRLGYGNVEAEGKGGECTFVKEGGTLICNGAGDSIEFAYADGYSENGNYSKARFYHNGGTSTFAGNLAVARDGTGEFYMNGGDVSVGDRVVFGSRALPWGEQANVYLNGGVFEAKGFNLNETWGGVANVVFDGGTFKAKANGDLMTVPEWLENGGNYGDFLKFTVKAGGGTIDLARHSVTMPIPIEEDSTSTGGGMTFKGGGTVAFAATNTYTGTTTLELGTAISVPSPVATDKLVLTMPAAGLADGIYPIEMITGDSAFAADYLGNVTKPVDANLQYLMSDDRKMVYCVYGNPPNTWIGGSSGSLSESANWSFGVVPTNGNCVISSSMPANLTIGATFAPDAITFSAISADVTINAANEESISGITAITNLSASTHVINVPVAFDGEILVVQGAMSWELKDHSSVRFAGGVTGTTFAEGTAKYLDGVFTLTTGEGWMVDTYEDDMHWGIPAGSSLATPMTTNTCGLALGDESTSGGAFTAGVVRTSERLTYANNGEYVVTNELEMTMYGDVKISERNSYGAFKFEKITLGSGEWDKYFYFGNPETWKSAYIWIGEGGLNFADGASAGTAYCCGSYWDIVRLRPWHSDYTIATKTNKTSTADLVIHDMVYFGTDDENGVPRTVTCNGLIDNLYGTDASSVFVEGAGTFVVNNPGNTYTGPWTVKDTATLMVSSGSKTGTGIVSVETGATLATTGTGTATVGTNLTFADDACIGFNFTTKSTPPVLDLTGTDVVFGSNIVVKVSAADGIRPFTGAHVLTSGGKFAGATVSLAVNAPKWALGVSVVNREIVLNVKPMGTRIIVR